MNFYLVLLYVGILKVTLSRKSVGDYREQFAFVAYLRPGRLGMLYSGKNE